MGSTTSINDTILGQSLVGTAIPERFGCKHVLAQCDNTFRTKVPFEYTRYHNNTALESRAYLSVLNSKTIGPLVQIINPGLVFTVKNVEKRWGVDTGASLYIYVTINKLAPSSDTSWYEKDNTRGSVIMLNYHHIESTDEKPKSIMDYNKVPLIISAHGENTFPWSMFEFKHFGGNVDVNKPIIYDSEKIELL